MEVPKNFRSIGGIAGFGGDPIGTGGPAAAVRTGFIGAGIGLDGGAEFGEKMFRPEPAYSSDSVTFIASICSVGSICAAVNSTGAPPALPAPAGSPEPVAGADVVTTGADGC